MKKPSTREIAFRPYTRLDRDSCLNIFDSNCPLFFDPAERELFKGWLLAHEERRVTYGNSESDHYFVLEQNGQPVACAGFYKVKQQPLVRLAWGMVARSLHKKGLGSMLLSERLTQIRICFPGCKVELGTSQHTCRFYESKGFTVVNRIADGYGKDLHRYDMILEDGH